MNNLPKEIVDNEGHIWIKIDDDVLYKFEDEVKNYYEIVNSWRQYD